MSSQKIRLLKTADLPHLLSLSRQAKWNQTEADWARLLTLSPQTCFGIEADGQIVASTTATIYARDLAWIGMVLTAESHRGQGMATALLQHTLAYLKEHEVAWAKLDATEQGRLIYAKLGFQDEFPVERWRRPAGKGFTPNPTRPVHPYVIDPSFDRAYFGAYRVPLLNALKNEAQAELVVGYGFAMNRAGDQARYFGPSVVRTRDAAKALLDRFLAKYPNEEIYWDLLPDNSDAVQLAIDTGFEPSRHLMRMGLACQPDIRPLVQNSSSVFAIAGFEYG
jgi:GNAT superfamily N-acetyltransferase